MIPLCNSLFQIYQIHTHTIIHTFLFYNVETPVLHVCSFSEYFLCFFTVHLFFSCLFDSSFVYEYHFLSAYDIVSLIGILNNIGICLPPACVFSGRETGNQFGVAKQAVARATRVFSKPRRSNVQLELRMENNIILIRECCFALLFLGKEKSSD